MSRPRLPDLLRAESGPEIERRFWSSVEKRAADECWEWTRRRNERGYGRFDIGRRSFLSNRVSFVIAFGWEPPMALHKCDNPPCVNPRHLFGGTALDNARDCVAKGRFRRQIGPAVRSTVVALAECGLTQNAVARQVGVSRASVVRILSAYRSAAS